MFDPFSGSGCVPLESLLAHRGAIANDINPYAAVLTQAKMFPPAVINVAMNAVGQYARRAKRLAQKDSYRVFAPRWVRAFFHKRTLVETKILADMLRRDEQWFILANLLGILHHQRPGFLSNPSSHLVPYLRTRKFPRAIYPHLYSYRDVEPRLVAKIKRTMKKSFAIAANLPRVFTTRNLLELEPSKRAHLAITSPPYMNALDYGRDNRLRLWFLGIEDFHLLDSLSPRSPQEFHSLMVALAKLLTRVIRPGGKAVLIVGEVRREKSTTDTSRIARHAFEADAGAWILREQITDLVPDIRRSRRGCSATRREWVMVFSRN